jgi:HK97 family phage prohead protease
MSEQLLIRKFPSELTLGDGRTLQGRCVPYGVAAPVADPGETYRRELFVRGTFARAVRAAQRVFVNFEHRLGMMDTFGAGRELEERDDGLWGIFDVWDGPVGDHALTMHRAGALGFFSVGFVPIGRGRRDGDLVVRTHCHLDHVGLVREAAYPGTEVVARSADPMWEPPARDRALDERLAALRAAT